MALNDKKDLGPGISVTMKVDMSKLENMIEFSPLVADECSFDTADWIKAYIQSHWSPNAPSNPYNPPAVRDGTLNANIKITRRQGGGRFGSKGNSISWQIEAQTVYAAALEFGKVNAPNTIIRRPYMRPAVEAARRKFTKFFYPIINPRTLVYNKARGAFVGPRPHLEGINLRVDESWDVGGE